MAIPVQPAAAGIVRPARRPAGWVAPGPAPAGAVPGRDVGPRAGEDLCYLAGDWRILQRLDGHRWSLDDLVTAWLAAEVARGHQRAPARIIDLGCGIGTVLMLLAWRFPEARCVGVEAQEVSADLAQRSIVWNGVAARCEVRIGDLRDPAVLPAGATFDLVTGTPPYLAPGTATESPLPQRGPCRLEHRGGIEAYCGAAARLLAPTALVAPGRRRDVEAGAREASITSDRAGAGLARREGPAGRGAPEDDALASVGGRFIVCASAAQDARVGAAAGAAGLAMERRLEVVPREDKPPLFSVYAMRGARAAGPALRDERLTVRDRRGRRTEAFRAVRRAMGMPA